MFKQVCVAGLALALQAAHGQAGDRPVQDPLIRYGQYEVAHRINDDLSSVETRRWRMKVLQPQALDWAKKASISHSTSVQKVEVQEAYTLKADGRRIEVPRDNYQIQTSQGRDSNSPAFSDFSSVDVVFPDLAVGDSVVLAYRVVQSEPIFPGHFDAAYTFGRDIAFDDLRLSVDYPGHLAVQYAGRQMAQQEESLADGRKRVSWRWSLPRPLRSERRDFSLVNTDDEVGASFSTFTNYQAIAQAYGNRALPKAVPSARLVALAQEIVGRVAEPREQARLLYEWVSTHITYGGNCVGVGTVVPREVDKVLDNRLGDCKDHATLLQALLAARGVASEQALINAGNEYQLPRIPQVASVNHVLNYLPAFKLYVDATAKHQPFGVLPLQLRGKPVLHVGTWREDARTPVPLPARQQSTHSRWKLAADGSLSGTVKVAYQGDAAIAMRQWVRQQPQASQPDLVRDMLRGMGLNGQGKVELPDALALDQRYEITLTIDRIERFVRLPGPGAFYVLPLAGGTTVGSMVVPDDGTPVRHASACTSGTAIETYEIELPKGMKVSGLPPAAKWANSVQRYEASYVQKGQTLQVRRSLEDRTPTAVCSAATGEEYRQMNGRVIDNLKAQVLYR
jgi:transglutaminase-like putative cysteine protease